MPLPEYIIRAPDSARRYEDALAAEAHSLLQRHPVAQAERIADHYCSMATTALKLKMLCEGRRFDAPTLPMAAELIEVLCKQIETAHRRDLGLPLEWRKNEA